MHRRARLGAPLLNDEEEAHLDVDGVRRWLQCEYRPFFALNGELLGYNGARPRRGRRWCRPGARRGAPASGCASP
ncbi:MAG: hypothetical protein WDM92_11455 [Caulobacteraceae bacterium]